MHNGSRNVAVVVRNNTVYPQTLRDKVPVVRAIAATWVPEPEMWNSVIEALYEPQGLQMPKLTVKQRQEKLFEELDLSGMESWPPELADSTWSLLAEYHKVSSLEPRELGCSHSTEHVIKVTDEAPFKEHFRQIHPLLVGKSIHTCKRCWIQAWFTPARVRAVMW